MKKKIIRNLFFAFILFVTFFNLSIRNNTTPEQELNQLITISQANAEDDETDPIFEINSESSWLDKLIDIFTFSL